MRRLVAATALASLVTCPAVADGMQEEADVPQRVIEETAGSSTQQFILPAIVGAGFFFAYLVVTR